MLALMLVCAAPVVASYFMFYVVRPSGAGAAYSELITPVQAIPDIVAHDLDGAEVPLAGLLGQWLLVVVDSGACGPACEKRLFMQRQLREMVGRERYRVDKLWLVLDDAPVTPALRQALAASPAMHVLRLPASAVAAWLQPAAGQALADHLYLVDPMGNWMLRSPAQADPAKFKRDLDRLLRASVSWDKAGRANDPAASGAR